MPEILDPRLEIDKQVKSLRSYLRQCDITIHEIANFKKDSSEPNPGTSQRCDNINSSCFSLYQKSKEVISTYCTDSLMENASRCSHLITLSDLLAETCSEVKNRCGKFQGNNYLEQAYQYSLPHLLQKRATSKWNPIIENIRYRT